MLQLSRMADYGVVVMSHIARTPTSLHTSTVVATTTGLGEATVSKLLKALAKSGLLTSVRGAHGGYQLATTAGLITLTQIVEAVDGPINLTRCLDHGDGCQLAAHCNTKPAWQAINVAVRKAFSDVTLAQLVVKP